MRSLPYIKLDRLRDLPTTSNDLWGQLRIDPTNLTTNADRLTFYRKNVSGVIEGTRLATIDGSETLTEKTLRDVILDKSVETTGNTPTFAAQAAAGSTASTSGSAGNDTCGLLRLVPGGAGITTGAQVVITFAQARPDANFIVVLTPLSADAAAIAIPQPHPTSRGTTSWTLTKETAALTTALDYQWSYLVIEY